MAVAQYSPSIRCKNQFTVKSEAQSSTVDTQPYDLTFVTFLRHILTMEQQVDQSQKIIIEASNQKLQLLETSSQMSQLLQT